jgi:prepilin-type N-terminal cleavage/methylation domain-containing protein
MKKRRSKNFPGLTLIEMIMTISILVIGMAGVTVLFTKVWKNNAYTIAAGRASLGASQGLEKLIGYFRRARQGDDGSYAVKLANDNEITFYCDYDKDGITERIHIYKNGANILMGVTNPTTTFPKSYPSGDQENSTIIYNITNNADTPVFYYYNNQYAGDPADSPISTPAIPVDVRLVKIYLQIDIDPNRDPGSVNMQSIVEMRNLSDYDRI